MATGTTTPAPAEAATGDTDTPVGDTTDPADAPVETIVFDPFESPYRVGGPARIPEREPTPDWPADLKAEVSALERDRVAQALADHGYHQGRAAEALGLTYHQFRGYLRKYGIPSRPSPRRTD